MNEFQNFLHNFYIVHNIHIMSDMLKNIHRGVKRTLGIARTMKLF